MARKHNPRGSVGRPLNRTFIVIGDGETEVAYFTQMKRSERLQINLQPELPSKKHSGWQYILTSAENFAKDKTADGIYCLIDMDKVIEIKAHMRTFIEVVFFYNSHLKIQTSTMHWINKNQK